MLPTFLERVSGSKCCALLNSPGLPAQIKHEVVKSQVPTKQAGAKSKTTISMSITNFPKSMENIRELVIMHPTESFSSKAGPSLSPCLIPINLE
jgi:hypothetical protein